MKKFLKVFILTICFIASVAFFVTACGNDKTKPDKQEPGKTEPDKQEPDKQEPAKISSFSVELANASYVLVGDTITVTYGENYSLYASDFSITAAFDDESSKTLSAEEFDDYGFTFESDIPVVEKTPAGTYEISIKHEDTQASKTISLAVEKAAINYSESDIEWGESEFVYDGTEKTVTITNLPSTLKATYQNNAKTNADEYTLAATICAADSDNYAFEEITVEHNWKITLTNYSITYENTFDLENNNPTTYTLISEDITLAPLSGRAYYTFDGWYYNDEKITTIQKGFTGGNVTLKAKWTPIAYTITYQDVKDVVNDNPTTYTIEDGTITLKPLANRVDYTFRYWERVYDDPYKVDVSSTTEISVSKHKGNITLKAVWDRKTEYDAFEYTVSEDCTKATITGLKNTAQTEITIPSGVVAIGDSAFKNCTLLSTVRFEEGIQLLTIGDYAFYYCGIQSITIPATVTEIGNYAFSRSGISEMNFSSESSLTTIGSRAFDSCSYLTEFTIPDSVVSMGQYVFDVCISLTKVVFGKGMTVIGENVYGGSSVLREAEFKGIITSFHQNALSGVATKNVTLTLNWNQKFLEKEVYMIIGGGSGYSDDYRVQSGYYRATSDATSFCGFTFSEICLTCDATDMTAEEFSSALEPASSGLFTSLKFILPTNADDYFPSIATLVSKYDFDTVRLTIEGANSIPESTFLYCSSLKEVIIGDGVTRIENGAFESCSYLQKITLGKDLIALGESAFYVCCATEIEIPDSVISIGKTCFNDCRELESIKLSSSITEISDCLFGNCVSLKSIIIPDGVTAIGRDSISGCYKLESIVIPKSVTTISYHAIYDCKSLTTIYYTGTAESDWQSISVATYNDSLNAATVYYYSKTQPTTAGNYWHYVNGVPTVW